MSAESFCQGPKNKPALDDIEKEHVDYLRMLYNMRLQEIKGYCSANQVDLTDQMRSVYSHCIKVSKIYYRMDRYGKMMKQYAEKMNAPMQVEPGQVPPQKPALFKACIERTGKEIIDWFREMFELAKRELEEELASFKILAN